MVKKTQNDPKPQAHKGLGGLQKRIYSYAAFAVLTIMLTAVLLFAATTAWYTNVAKTSDLVFRAASWGFQGDVQLQDQGEIKAIPGNSGTVALSLTNTSDHVVSAGVNVSREAMDAEMQKRIYFYVDAPATVNGEVLERNYLSNSGCYTYTILPGGSLVLGEGISNDAPLKWEWVYDVLGYYFEGTYDVNTGKMEILQYLRPVIYDLDKATFEDVQITTEEGTAYTKWLATVDGTKSVQQFITELTETDGYPGTVTFEKDAEQTTPHTFFEISLDPGTTHGVWLYLCRFDEIEAETRYDTWLGMAADASQELHPASTAQINIYGQQEQLVTTNVSTPEGLADALTGNSVDLITLDANVELSSTVRMTAGKQAVLDLNGKALTYSGEGAMIRVEKGSNLVMYNGEVKVSHIGPLPEAIQVRNGSLTMEKVKIINNGDGIAIRDNLEAGQDSLIRLKDCEISSSEASGIMVFGNGGGSQQKTRLIMDGCKITSDYVGVIGNGTVGVGETWGTDVVIRNSTILGRWSAIYQPQKESTLTADKCTLSGYTGVVIKGGSASFVDCTIVGDGERKEPAFSGAGFTDTGAGVYVETNYGWPVHVEISGDQSNIKGARGGDAVLQYKSDATHASISITGGLFGSDVSDFTAAGYSCKQAEGGYGHRVTKDE